MERDIVEILREDAGVIRPNLLTNAADAIEWLRAERDQARREVCSLDADTIEDRIEYARQRGWDCFKEDRR